MIGHLAAPIRIENDTLSTLYGSAFQKRLLDNTTLKYRIPPNSDARLIRVSAALHNSIEITRGSPMRLRKSNYARD